MKFNHKKVNEFQPSSPLKAANFQKENIIPFKNLNSKTYFKSIEHNLSTYDKNKPLF
jgi:hypothetical protein